MRRLSRVWPALEAIAGLAGIPATWREHLGDEADAVAGFLRPTDRRAARFPCPSPGGDGCPRQIIDRHDGTFIATCGDRPQRCDAVELSDAERTIHDLDVHRFADSLVVVLGLTSAFQHVTACPQTWQLGTYTPLSGHSYPAYLTIQDSPDQAYAVAVRLAGIAAGPLLLFVPTRRVIDPVTSELVTRSQSRIIALEDLVAIDDRGRWVAQRPPNELFREFRVAVLGEQSTSAPVVRFPTPPGARWEELTIRFITQHQVHVRVRSTAGTYEHTQMDMANKRNDQPTKQWELLQLFAQHGGELTWSDFGADPKNEHRRQILARQLRELFGIEGDPFDKLPGGHGWRTRFTIVPEA
jgi:hypothetical protein